MASPPTRRERLLAFDPNKPNTSPWATYVVGRRPEFKMHASRSSALGSMAMSGNLCALYEFVDGAWVTVGMKDREGTRCTCNMCLRSTIKHMPHGHYTWNSRRIDAAGTDMYDVGKYDWKRSASKIVNPLQLLYLCQSCYNRNR